MQLRRAGRIDIDRPATQYLAPDIMAGIHVLRGIDSSARVTVRDLLAHTSGIADYFEQKRNDGGTTFERALAQDFSWSFADVLRITKEQMSPRFAPSSPGRAAYSDTNYQILGALIEAVTGETWEDAVRRRVIEPLGLVGTYPFTHATVERYDNVAAMLYGRLPVRIPLAMASVRADGGMVSTAADGLTFLKAFIGGAIFSRSDLEEMTGHWRHLFVPLEYGVGVMRFALPRWLSPLRRIPPMIGHSGASGAVLFYAPDLDLFVSGTVNQIRKRSLSCQVMVRLVLACEDAWR